MTDTIIAVYDNATHAEQAIAALRRAHVPETAIHRHTREGDDLISERPPIVQSETSSFWPTLFGSGEAEEHLVYDDSPEGGGTVVRVTMIPDVLYDAVLDLLERYHPVDLKAREAR
jgi:hypothetical protein